ncbi:PilZ domain-containing protein [Bacillus sp. FJAT-49736]|uniref:PilZ domain-containing protein n=1 Tax=Bacillus sp. FJAT-49736 TaxID=2833582 RepID=UPI0020167FF3|nr:PilZ domain-containing protein [Bacillus sp. FJAT-49736]
MLMLLLAFILLFCSFIIILFIIFINNKNKKMDQVDLSLDQMEEAMIPQPFINKRKNFRVEVDNLYCIIKFNHFGNPKYEKLKDKTIEGYIEDISLSGMKFSSDYELPVRSDINILISFQLDHLVFSVKGKIVRRQDHLNNENVTYGIEFAELLPNQEKQLSSWLNRKIVSK